jgi:flagellar biosynthesis protein FlhB
MSKEEVKREHRESDGDPRSRRVFVRSNALLPAAG